MKKYEYKFLQVPTKGLMGSNVNVEQLMEELNILGQNGWEVAASFEENQMQQADKYTILIVKREIV